jgi:pSer/pThr/pTyr-binding forkhead associated (FHA) protein
MTTNAALTGSLEAFELPEVLTFLSTTRKSGMLALTSDRREAYVFFDAGALVYAASNQDSLRLSAILLRKRMITRDQHETIEKLMASEGGRFGKIAVEQGVITDAQLRDFLKIQVSEILFDCFIWKSGTFTFAAQTRLPTHAVTIAIDLSNLIMEGARRISEWEECLRLLPDKLVVFKVISTPEKDNITLSLDEWKILFLINGKRTLEDLCNDAPEDEPMRVYRVVYGLFANKLIEPAAAPLPWDDSTPGVTRPVTPILDETVRQPPANFSFDSTVAELPDDTSLLVSSDARLSYADVVKKTVAQLTITSGDANGTVIALTESEYLLGRGRDNQIQLQDLGISSRHARIYSGSEGYVIEDLKSRNGTWVNSARVEVAPLSDGDLLRLGATDLTYQVLFGS